MFPLYRLVLESATSLSAGGLDVKYRLVSELPNPPLTG